ncbi:MAG: hypothetical protein Q8L98_01340 [Chlamydiales bacterium]|nr:hypothetical protein [Chlamydiales bacterium]
MMKPITIAQRFRPFSHKPGSACLIPGTWWSLQAFPALLRLSHEKEILECALHLTGPVEQFTLQQDMEKRCVWVFGRAKEGYFRLRLTASSNELTIYADKTPPSGLRTSLGDLTSKGSISLPMQWAFYEPSHLERLSLGSHKEQKWEAVSSRLDLKELLPPLLYLAQHLPPTQSKGPLFLDSNEDMLKTFFRTHCSEIFIPQLIDPQHQGIHFPSIAPYLSAPPCALFQEAASWIRSLFVKVENNRIFMLPNVPPSFDCGRFTHLLLGSLGALDLEWSKSSLRRAVFRPAVSGELFFIPPKPFQSFRVITERGKKGIYQKTAEPLMVKAGIAHYLDCFQ